MAVSATVTPGAVVSQTDQITVSLLNQIANPTVDISGSVGSLAIGAGAIYNSNINADAAVVYSKMESTVSGKLIVGNDSNESAIVSLSGDASLAFNASTGNADLTIGADKITTAKILDDNITTAKILDANITTAKLANLDPSPAGSFTHSSVTINAQGQVTAAASGTVSHPTARIQSFPDGGTWTAPSGVTRAKFTIVGGGGGGYGVGWAAIQYRGGGGGGIAIVSAAVTPSTGYAITVGGGGTDGSYGTAATNGGDSTVVVGATTYTGGGGNKGGTSSGLDGSGGTATNGDVDMTGGGAAIGSATNGMGTARAAGGHAMYPDIGTGGDTQSAGKSGIVIVEWVE